MQLDLIAELKVRIIDIEYIPAEKPTAYSPGCDEEIYYEIQLVDKTGKAHDVRLPSEIEDYIREQLDEKVSDELHGEFEEQEIEHGLAMSA